ncbi:putative tuberin [Diaporthe ampelina]|uniref:Putative tuberin n=1 Tax=Diaporthe ampelina TaxID=1214573 RepID=A0A0G2IGB7_9PEZI|nr:putative tuberin [Diaporthe ampelina]
MLRRIASLGFEAPDAPPGDSMPPSADDQAPLPEPKSAGGLASVFKGLTGGSKLSKVPPVPSSSTDTVSAQLSSERVDTASLAATGLPPHHGEALEKLKTGSLSERIAAAESLRLSITDYPLAPVLQIWDAGKDLIETSKPSSARVAGWELLTECVRNPSSTDLERKEYFQTLSFHANPDDFYLQLAALVDLTNHGRNLSGFDYDVIPLLTTWLQDSYNAVRVARRQQAVRERKGSKGKGIAPAVAALGEDKSFSMLFAFILEVLKFNFRVADDETLGRLIDKLLEICMKTSTEDDLTACIEVIDAIITYASVPKRNLSRCVEVLSSIFCLVDKLSKTSWHTLSNLLKSHNGQAAVRILLNILRDYPRNGQETTETNRAVRGSLTVLQKLIWKSSEKGYPSIPLAILVDGCSNVVEKSPSTRIAGSVLKLINTLFDDGEQKMNPLLEGEDWTSVLEVAEKCVGRLNFNLTPNSSRTSLKSNFTVQDLKKGGSILEELETLLRRLEGLSRQRGSDFVQRHECIAFMANIPHVLPDSTTELVLEHFKEFRCCYPSDLEWEKNLDLVLESFFLKRNRSTPIRIAALRGITEVYDMLELVEDELDEDIVPNIVRNILSGISGETDTLVLKETVSFMVSVALAADTALFDYIVETLKGVVMSDPSPVLFSYMDKTTEAGGDGEEIVQAVDQETGVLDVTSWLEAIIHNLTHGSDWEVYSFNLVHLASQLSNHAFFRGAIPQKMSTVITQANVAMHILEFLAVLARMPALYSNFIEDEFRVVFGMCFRYLDTVRDKKRYVRTSTASENVPATINTTHEYDILGQPTNSEELPQYVHALAYHVIVFWFLALRLSDRAKHVGWIAKRLFQGPDGNPVSDEQALITMDFIQRVAYAEADESAENPRFSDRKASEYTERRWIIANSLVSIKQSKTTPWAQVTKRQPSGTSYFTVRENFKPPPPHQANTFGDSRDTGTLTTNSTIPSHLLVHLLSSTPQSYEPALRPLPLPDEEAVSRSVRTFDRISTVDGHKVGVIYIGENQTKETEILANVSGSADYMDFLNGIGSLTKLKGADFNTQGLDREYDTDGQYTFCWRDRVTEIVFHVTTQMPTNLDHDPQCISKKRHIGNDFVNIIFNDSGLPFKFDTFPSEFNYVNIVITPESRASFVATREHGAQQQDEGENAEALNKRGYTPFFKVQVMSKEGFPEISPCAATKMVSLKALPDFVRLLALNASVFSLVWAHRDQATFLTTTSEQNSQSHRSSVITNSTADTEIMSQAFNLDSLVESLDFSKWA